MSNDQQIVDRIKEIGRQLDDASPGVIGDRLRRMRTRQSLSVRELAARAEISKTSLVRIEQGRPARATTVLAVCAALGVHIQRVLDPEDDDLVLAATHVREDDCWHDLRDFGSGPLGGADGKLNAAERDAAGRSGAVPLCMLKSRLPDGQVLPSVIELYGPTETRRHAGSEFVFVLEGRLTITVGEREFTLARSESISFRSAESHRYAPTPGSDLPTRILSVRIDERPTETFSEIG